VDEGLRASCSKPPSNRPMRSSRPRAAARWGCAIPTSSGTGIRSPCERLTSGGKRA